MNHFPGAPIVPLPPPPPMPLLSSFAALGELNRDEINRALIEQSPRLRLLSLLPFVRQPLFVAQRAAEILAIQEMARIDAARGGTGTPWSMVQNMLADNVENLSRGRQRVVDLFSPRQKLPPMPPEFLPEDDPAWDPLRPALRGPRFVR